MMQKLSRENYDAKIITRKASLSVLLYKSEVTYRDTGVSKNVDSTLDKVDFKRKHTCLVASNTIEIRCGNPKMYYCILSL